MHQNHLNCTHIYSFNCQDLIKNTACPVIAPESTFQYRKSRISCKLTHSPNSRSHTFLYKTLQTSTLMYNGILYARLYMHCIHVHFPTEIIALYKTGIYATRVYWVCNHLRLTSPSISTLDSTLKCVKIGIYRLFCCAFSIYIDRK
jgi:hypothetical protein